MIRAGKPQAGYTAARPRAPQNALKTPLQYTKWLQAGACAARVRSWLRVCCCGTAWMGNPSPQKAAVTVKSPYHCDDGS